MLRNPQYTGLPDDRNELLHAAMQAVVAFNDAILAGDEESAIAADNRYWGIIIKLNGNELCGCTDRGNPEAGGILAREFCKASPGTAPIWSQDGIFAIEVDGVRAVVEVGDGFSPLFAHFQFHAIDVYRTFISETGYRSCFEKIRLGMTVLEMAEAIFASLLTKGRMSAVRKETRDRNEDPLSRWSWLLDAQLRSAVVPHAATAPQLAFSF